MTDETKTDGGGSWTVERVGFLILRAFFAEFWLLQFYGKAHDAATGVTSLENLARWSAKLTAGFVSSTPLPEFMVTPYTRTAPFIELTLGLLILVGFQTRWALLGAAAFLVSLDLGLMLQADHDTVKSNTIILLALLWAAQWSRSNIYSVDDILAKRRA
ncbi:MAG: DoxX family membrane protein [Polyangiaceae bacterium]